MKETLSMKTFYSIKNRFEKFGCCVREWLHAAVIGSYNKSGTYGCLMNFRQPVLTQNLKKYEINQYTFPSYWKNLVRGRRAAKISEQHKRLEKRKNTDIDQIWQLQVKESVVSLRQDEMQYEVWILMLQIRDMILLNVGSRRQYVFLLPVNYKFSYY